MRTARLRVITWIVQGHLPTPGLIWEVNVGFWFHMFCQPATLSYLNLFLASDLCLTHLVSCSVAKVIFLNSPTEHSAHLYTPSFWWFTTAHRFSRICSSPQQCVPNFHIQSYLLPVILPVFLWRFSPFPFLNHILSPPSSSSALNILLLTFSSLSSNFISNLTSRSTCWTTSNPLHGATECYLCLFLCETLNKFLL